MELECKLLLFIYMYYFKKSILLITGVGNFMPSIYTFIYKMPVIAITMKISAKLPSSTSSVTISKRKLMII